MLHKIIDHLLKTFGREVLEQWIPLNNLSITSIAEPELRLTNVPLPDKLFESPSIPFLPIRSNLGSVVVKCPWKAVLNNDGNAALSVDIHDVDVILRFKRIDEWKPEHVQGILSVLRSALLSKWNSLSSLGLLSGTKREHGSKAVSLINSIEITVNNIKIVLVDNILYKEPFSITIEAEKLRGVGMQPDDPSLTEDERKGIEKSVFSALWFHSTGVHIWHSIYHQEADACDQASQTEKKRKNRPPAREARFKKRGAKEAASESDHSDYSHSSDELFDDVENGGEAPVGGSTEESHLWNFCTAPCRDLTEHEWTQFLVQEAKEEDQPLVSILRGPYKIYNITPSKGVRFDLVFKNWNLAAFGSLDNMHKHPRRTVQLFFSAVGEDDGHCVPRTPCFNGTEHFDPFPLTITSAGAEVLYNIIRYMQLSSIFREMASGRLNDVPEVEDCERYIKVISSSHWSHREGDVKFVEAFERDVPFHIFLKLRNLVHSSNKRSSSSQVCFIGTECCSQGDHEDSNQEFTEHIIPASHEWFGMESVIRIIFANVNVCLVPLSGLQGDGVINSTMMQMSTFVFEGGALYKRATYKILAAKPIIRFGGVRVRVKKRTFSAKVSLVQDQASESLLSYPEKMFTYPCEFFRDFGADDLWVALSNSGYNKEDIFRITIERYPDRVKHIHVMMPKMVIVFNVVAQLNSMLDEGFWNMGFITLEQFIERSRKEGHANDVVAEAMLSQMQVVSSRTIFKFDMEGVMVRTLIQNGSQCNYVLGLKVDGLDQPKRSLQEQTVLDWFLSNNRELNMWQYCEDIDNPFSLRNMTSRRRDELGTGRMEGMPNTIYCRENFVAELDASVPRPGDGSSCVLVPGGESMFPMDRRALNYLTALRRWYHNSCAVVVPRELTEGLGGLYSLTISAKKIEVTKDSATDVTCCILEDLKLSVLDSEGSLTHLIDVGLLNVIKRLNLVCVEMEAVEVFFDSNISVFKTLINHSHSIKTYGNYLMGFISSMKNLTYFEPRNVACIVTLVGDPEICAIIRQDFYEVSPHASEECSPELLDALDRKLLNMENDKKIVFVSIQSVNISMTAENRLYEFMLNRLQLEARGRERIDLQLRSITICETEAERRRVILASRTSDLGKDYPNIGPDVENGQLVASYQEKESRTINIEIRNVQHMVDMEMCKRLMEIVKQLRPSSSSAKSAAGKKLLCNFMMHHSSFHYEGIGVMIDAYTVVNISESDMEKSITVKIPRYHATFTRDLTKRVLAFSFLDVNFEMHIHHNNDTVPEGMASERIKGVDAKVVNVVLGLSHFVAWGLHDVPEGVELRSGFENVQEAADNLEMLLNETWFNHMTAATLPSYYDDDPMVLIALVSTQYSEAARLTPILNQTSITDWLIAASQRVEPYLCDGAAAKIIKSCSKGMVLRRQQSVIQARVSAMLCDGAIVSMGQVELASLEIFLDGGSIRNISDLFSRCKTLLNKVPTSKEKETKPRIFKIDFDIGDISVICSAELVINGSNTMSSVLLPTTVVETPLPKKRPLWRTSGFHILCMYRFPRVYLTTSAEWSIVFQSGLTVKTVGQLNAKINGLKRIKKHFLFDHSDVLHDAKYQATLHFRDSKYKDGRGKIISFNCSKWDSTVYTTADRFEYWKGFPRQSYAGENGSTPGFRKLFEQVLCVNMVNVSLDLCVEARRVYTAKLTIQKINVTDAWGRYLLADVYEDRCKLGNMGHIDDAAFYHTADQVYISIRASDELFTVKASLEHTRSELQINGISLIVGLMQDLGFLKNRDTTRNSDTPKKRILKLGLTLTLHEFWFYPAFNDEEVYEDTLQSSDTLPAFSQVKSPSFLDSENTVPCVLKNAKEVEYRSKRVSSSLLAESEQTPCDGSVIGCLLSLSVSSSKKGHSNVNLKYMGVALGIAKVIDGVKMLVDDHDDCFFNTLDSDERMLFEFRESVLKSKRLENDCRFITFQASKPKISVNVDQLYHLRLLKKTIIEDMITVIKAHKSLISNFKEPVPFWEATVRDTCDLYEEIRFVASKYNLPMVDPSDVRASVYNMPPEVEEKNRLSLDRGEKKDRAINKILDLLNHLSWKDGDKNLILSVMLNDCKCILFSVKHELVLNLNLHHLAFDHTHSPPASKRTTVVDSTSVFNVTTYNSSLKVHDTVLKNTVVTLQVACENKGHDTPSLDINMHVSGLSLEINACFLQLFKQLNHASSAMSSKSFEHSVILDKAMKLYNELEVPLYLASLNSGRRTCVDILQLSPHCFTQVSDKEVYLFMKDHKAHLSGSRVLHMISGQFEAVNSDVSLNTNSEWIVGEGKNLLFGNSNNVKSLLHMLKDQGSTADSELNLEEVYKLDRSLALLGKYQMEHTGSRIFNMPHIGGLILIEQLLSEENKPYVMVSSSIRIQNATDIPLKIAIDQRLSYFSKVAYKLTQQSKPKVKVRDINLLPYTSSCVPLGWFGTNLMPTIVPIYDSESFNRSGEPIPFHYLHNLLNVNQLAGSEFERVQEFTLRFKGFISLRCSVISKEAASANDCNACFYHFTIKIEPMVKLANILPCDIYVALALNRTNLNGDVRLDVGERTKQLRNYKVQRRLKMGETLGIPFSEQKLFMRISVFGTQLVRNGLEGQDNSQEFEYLSPVFQIYLPSVGSASIVKMLKIIKGCVNKLYNKGSNQRNNDFKSFEEYLTSMWVTLDLSRNDIRVWWPYMFENVSSCSLMMNGCLLEPMGRFYGNLSDASNCRIRAVLHGHTHLEGGAPTIYSMSPSVKLDLTSTTDFRTPMNLVVPLQKRTLTQANFSKSSVNFDGVLQSIANADQIHHQRRYVGREEINSEYECCVNEASDEEKSALDVNSDNSAVFCLGSTVRYAEYPYNMCKIASITNHYTFVNQLPFTVCIRGSPEEHKPQDIGQDAASDVIITPGGLGAFHYPFQRAYLIKVENDISSGIFSLHYPCLPYVFQLELNSNNITYSTMATRGLLVQVNVISGHFEGSNVPYSYNGYYFVLSVPHRPHYQLLNLTKYTLAYTVPENMKTVESQMVDQYENYEATWLRTPMNKIGILPPTCITHYVPSASSKPQDGFQVCLKVLHVDACDWCMEHVNFVREGCHVIKFVHGGEKHMLYIIVIIRSNGTRIITLVDSKEAAIELSRLGNSSPAILQQLQWSNINISFLTPRITVTLSTKRKVILALHLTNAALSIALTPSKVCSLDAIAQEASQLQSRPNLVEFDVAIQSIHIDHFLQGCIPVILKSSTKRSSRQESFLHVRVISSNFLSSALPVYELIHAKVSPLSINIEICVIEQLIESIENMLRLPIGDAVSRKDGNVRFNTGLLVLPQPRWVEMEPAPPVYIRMLTVEPINLILAIRTSSLQLAHQTMRILDALPLDTPCVCVHFAREEREYMIVGWHELIHSLRNSYLRQLIRQSLPSAWLSNSFAVLYGVLKGLGLLIVQPLRTVMRFKNPFEGFAVGLSNGVMIFTLYIVGGAAQSLGHILNIFHKIIGGHRSKPQGVLDAIWLGMNVFLLHVFYRPWKKLLGDLASSQSKGDGLLKASIGFGFNLARCLVSPLIGVVNMVITFVEGFSNVLLGDFEQFTHVYESDQLEKSASNTHQPTKHSQIKDGAAPQTSFVRRMKTSVASRRMGS